MSECKKCGQVFSDDIRICPNCNEKIDTENADCEEIKQKCRKTKNKLLVIIAVLSVCLILLGIAFGFNLFGSKSLTDSPKARTKSLTGLPKGLKFGMTCDEIKSKTNYLDDTIFKYDDVIHDHYLQVTGESSQLFMEEIYENCPSAMRLDESPLVTYNFNEKYEFYYVCYSFYYKGADDELMKKAVKEIADYYKEKIDGKEISYEYVEGFFQRKEDSPLKWATLDLKDDDIKCYIELSGDTSVTVRLSSKEFKPKD